MGQSLSLMSNWVATSPGKSELLDKLARKIRMNIPLDEKWTEILRETVLYENLWCGYDRILNWGYGSLALEQKCVCGITLCGRVTGLTLN